MWLWRSSLAKVAAQRRFCRSGNDTVRRALNKRQRASVALLDLGSLGKPGIPAGKNSFSRAGYPFHSRTNSPFQQRSNGKKKKIKIEIFHVNRGEKEPQFTSCYELRMWYNPVLQYMVEMPRVWIYLCYLQPILTHTKLSLPLTGVLSGNYLNERQNFLQRHLIQHFHHL